MVPSLKKKRKKRKRLRCRLSKSRAFVPSFPIKPIQSAKVRLQSLRRPGNPGADLGLVRRLCMVCFIEYSYRCGGGGRGVRAASRQQP